MVLLKVLGIMDLLSGAVMLLLHFHLIGWRLAFSFASYLLFKAFIWRGDLASFFDLFAGVYIIALIFGVHSFLTFIFAGYIIQKAVFSLL